MTDRLTFGFLPRFGGLAFVVALGACSSTGFVDEDSDKHVAADDNLAKSLLMASGAIEDPNAKALQYSPRAPLVVPPQRTLPQPVDADAELAKSKFPVNPEDADLQRRLAVGNDTVGENVMTPDQQKKYKNLPTSGPGVETGRFDDHDASRRLQPWELDGKAQQQALAGAEKTSPHRKQDALIAPPESYRTPSPKAPMQAEEQQASWKPTWWPF
ncbi:MAG: hypothetical protein P4L82_23575 [Ancalomicrobiaceae bacterium]|nr:hypothetical protein [Ancalomicrobiaceae bacterium]